MAPFFFSQCLTQGTRAVGGDGPDASNGGDGDAANESHLGTIISACKVATILAEDGHITRAALADLTSCSASARFTRLRPMYQDPPTAGKGATVAVQHATGTCIAS